MSRRYEILKSLIAAWCAGDVDGALSHMSEDIVWHYAAAVAPPLAGKAKARKFLERFKSEVSEVRWRIFDHAERGDRLFVEGVDEFITTQGVRVLAPYAGVLEFRGDLICAWKDYVDVGVMDAQRAGQPATAWVAALADRPGRLMAMEISGGVALVTGGNRGIGEAFVRAFLAAGARRVHVGARDPANAAHLEREFPGRAVALRLDVTQPDQIATAARDCGEVSILVNNAGAFHNRRLIASDDIAAARDEMEVNYFGPLQMCRAFAPVLAANGGGAIVQVLSSGGLVAVPAMGGYSPSKFAGRAAATCIRAELAGQGTQVCALIVGSVDTRMAAHVAGAKEPPSVIAEAGLLAIRRNIDELDTDRMAVEVRASLHRDPKALERSMARMLSAAQVSTGR